MMVGEPRQEADIVNTCFELSNDGIQKGKKQSGCLD